MTSRRPWFVMFLRFKAHKERCKGLWAWPQYLALVAWEMCKPERTSGIQLDTFTLHAFAWAWSPLRKLACEEWWSWAEQSRKASNTRIIFLAPRKHAPSPSFTNTAWYATHADSAGFLLPDINNSRLSVWWSWRPHWGLCKQPDCIHVFLVNRDPPYPSSVALHL